MGADGAGRKKRQVRLESQVLERVTDSNKSGNEVVVELIETDGTKMILD